MSTFREKNIKFNKNNTDEKKSEHYNIIDVKHTEIMDGFEAKSNNLQKYKDEYEDISSEIFKIQNETELNIMIEELQNKITKTEEKILDIENTDDNNIKKPKKTKKNMKSIVVHSAIDNRTNKEILLDKTNKILENYVVRYNTLNTIYLRNCHINDLNARKDILEEEIYNIENNIEELEYFDETYDILYDYYEKDDDVKKSDEINICDLFTNQKPVQNTQKKKECVDKYLQTINEKKRSKRSGVGKSCSKCGIQKILNTQEGIYSCDNCGESEIIIIDSEKPSYKDPITDTKSNTYKRSNHCSELLNQSQGKESTDIEEQLYEDIKAQLHIIGVTDLTKITKSDIKQVLKNINKSTKSEHAVYIINKLNGIPVSTMSHKLNEMVKQMFSMVEEAWYVFKDPTRKNFMNTNYVFHKIFELLDEDEEAAKWPYLSDIKLAKHDDLWKKICNYHEWEFIPSI